MPSIFALLNQSMFDLTTCDRTVAFLPAFHSFIIRVIIHFAQIKYESKKNFCQLRRIHTRSFFQYHTSLKLKDHAGITASISLPQPSTSKYHASQSSPSIWLVRGWTFEKIVCHTKIDNFSTTHFLIKPCAGLIPSHTSNRLCEPFALETKYFS